jgi:hypothetical protein
MMPVSGQQLQLPPVTSEDAKNLSGSGPVIKENAAGRCTSVIVWTIDDGHFGETPLAGLGVMSLVQSPGPLFSSGSWRRALYIDSKASQPQQDALLSIFDGDAGGYFKRWKKLTAEFLGCKIVPIMSELSGQRRHVVIDGIMDLTTEPILGGPDKQPFQLVNPPFWKAPGENPTVGRCVMFRFQDYNVEWQLSGRTSCYSRFSYSGQVPANHTIRSD